MFMARKGNKRHLKALSAPKYFAVEKKEHMYVAKQNPGRFRLGTSVSLMSALERVLNSNARHAELKSIIKGKNVKVNYHIINDPLYPVGLNDIIELSKEGKFFKIGIDSRAKFSFEELKSEPAGRIQKIIGKFKIRKGKLMIRLYDGTIASYDKDANVNDSVIIGNDSKISKVIKMGTGAKCFVYNGVHVGETGTIKSITQGAANRDASAKIESSNAEFDTQLKNIMVVE